MELAHLLLTTVGGLAAGLVVHAVVLILGITILTAPVLAVVLAIRGSEGMRRALGRPGAARE